MNRTNAGASTDTTHMLLDVFIILLSFTITAVIYNDEITEEQFVCFFILACVQLVIYLLSNKEERVYNVTLFYYLDRIYRKITKSFAIGAIATSAILYYVADVRVGRKVYLVFLAISYVLLCANILFFRKVVERKLNKNIPRTVFVGKKDAFNKFEYFLKKTSIMIDQIGYICMEEDQMSPDYIGALPELEELIKKYNIDQIYIMQKRDTSLEYIQKYIDLCIEMGVTCRVIVDFYKRRKANSYVSSVGTYPVITYHTISLNDYEMLIKRVIDIFGALVGIVLSSPIMLITAIAIKIDSPGPILFKQVRVGQNGRHFKIYKFRSMYMDAEERKKELLAQNEIEGGVMFKMKNDPRITKVGRVIRKLSIDELPQFFNVLGGSMSLVGTRPPTIDEVEKYERAQWRRISIKPGITGMWQVNGRSNVQSFEEIVQMDVEYIDNWNLLLDFKIIFKTVLVLIHHNDAY